MLLVLAMGQTSVLLVYEMELLAQPEEQDRKDQLDIHIYHQLVAISYDSQV
jgi:hypothetical protein